MDTIPLSNVSNTNIAKILKKCNDTSFVRAIRTCRRFYDAANQMEKATRIFCHEYFPIFIYFDEKLGKAMFDVPWNRKKDENQAATAAIMEEEDEQISEEEKYQLYRDKAPRSLLNLMASDRKQAYHRKMTPEELGQLLCFFRFDQFYFNTTGAIDYHDKFSFLYEEMVKIFPYIRARKFIMEVFGRREEDDDLSHKTYQLAYDHLKFTDLRFWTTYFYGSSYGKIEELRIDWNSLETLKALCSEENFVNIQREFITRWESGQTNMKYLQLQVKEDRSNNFKFQKTGFFAKIQATPARGGYWKFYYNHSVSNNRWAISYGDVWRDTYSFHDITDCDGCDCQTEFCFKKLIEAIARNIKWDVPVDFGPVIDQWNSGERTMKSLGTLLKPFMIRIHRAGCCC